MTTLEYSRGFIEALQVIEAEITTIDKLIPKEKQLDAVLELIDRVYDDALERHVNRVKACNSVSWHPDEWLAESEAADLRIKQIEDLEREGSAAQAAVCSSPQ